jgi:hypothetical protein
MTRPPLQLLKFTAKPRPQVPSDVLSLKMERSRQIFPTAAWEVEGLLEHFLEQYDAAFLQRVGRAQVPGAAAFSRNPPSQPL